MISHTYHRINPIYSLSQRLQLKFSWIYLTQCDIQHTRKISINTQVYYLHLTTSQTGG